mmetsp:Transcript_61640/g.123599  ORF Transcript_61640/g.123599 Transcript_61640/m.123599 type:complete len:247 (-) Transcript_61640:284-1024(-)
MSIFLSLSLSISNRHVCGHVPKARRRPRPRSTPSPQLHVVPPRQVQHRPRLQRLLRLRRGEVVGPQPRLLPRLPGGRVQLQEPSLPSVQHGQVRPHRPRAPRLLAVHGGRPHQQRNRRHHLLCLRRRGVLRRRRHGVHPLRRWEILHLPKLQLHALRRGQVRKQPRVGFLRQLRGGLPPALVRERGVLGVPCRNEHARDGVQSVQRMRQRQALLSSRGSGLRLLRSRLRRKRGAGSLQLGSPGLLP